MNAVEQGKYLTVLERRCGPAMQGVEALTPEDRERLAAIMLEASAPGDDQIRAASLLAFAGNETAINAICGWMESEASFATRFAALINLRLPPLARSSRFVQLIIPRLDPADAEWEELLGLIVKQGVKETGPRLEEILRAGEFLPEWHVPPPAASHFGWLNRLAYLVSIRNLSMETLEATIRFLDPARNVPVELQPWAALSYFGGEPSRRRRILEFLKAFGDPPEPHQWCNYESRLCQMGDLSDLPEIEGLINSPKPIHCCLAATFVRLLGEEAVPRLIKLLPHPRWGLGASGQLGELLKGTGHAEAIAEMGKLAGATSETENLGRRLLGILQTVMIIGGPAAHAVVGEHINRVPEEARKDLWWEWSGLKLEDLAECMARHGAHGGRSPKACRERHPGYPESRMIGCIFGDHFLAVDYDSDQVPVPHDRMLERIADQLDWLGFRMSHISQIACGPEADGSCQYEIQFEFERTHHVFLASTQGTRFDMDHMMSAVKRSIKALRPSWDLYNLDEVGSEITNQDSEPKLRYFCQFLVIPTALKLELSSKFGIVFYEREATQ